jgi:hypothetical protein
MESKQHQKSNLVFSAAFCAAEINFSAPQRVMKSFTLVNNSLTAPHNKMLPRRITTSAAYY